MTNDPMSRCGVEIRQPRLTQQHLTNKSDEIEVLESAGADENPQESKLTNGWICCAPCIWIRTSTTVHKIALTAATLLVTVLLVASPVIFLLSTAPSQLPKDCIRQNEFDCHPTKPPALECSDIECRSASLSIQSRMNWKYDPCMNFKNYSYTDIQNSLKAIKTAQEIVDLQMQQLLAHNTTTGTFRKLGRLYGSCLRHSLNTSTIRLFLDELGGYLPIGTLGPSKLNGLISKAYALGPIPLIDVYYEISYGKNPHVMYVIDGPYGSIPVLPNIVRWKEPKSPPFCMREDSILILDELLNYFLPNGLSVETKQVEKESIKDFIKELFQVCRENIKKDFYGSYIKYNITEINILFSFFNWSDLIPSDWDGPILIKNENYLNGVNNLFTRHSKRIVHNSLLIVFAMGIIPPVTPPNPKICTKSTLRAMPAVSSALYLAQFPKSLINEVIERTEIIFEILKAHVKRAPSLKGTALIKLSQLRVKVEPWPVLSNFTKISELLDEHEISSDNWFENILKIYKIQRTIHEGDLDNANHTEWAYPTVAKVFYEPLSHSVVVPLSVLLVPYFDVKLPQYLQYASVGVSIAREIFRSITKPFERKLLNCVPSSISVFSNITNRMDILIYAGGMQIAYHSMLSLTGPMKGMIRLPGINLTPQQIYFVVFAQELCSDVLYNDGLNIKGEDFSDILSWLISQGASATEVYECPNGSVLAIQKTCTVL